MTLVQLKYVVAVDTYQHFAIAAEHCSVTQPTLSMQIGKLEKELDILLFDRSKHPVMPTEAGESLIAQAKVILREAARIDQIAQNSKAGMGGEFNLGIIPTVSSALLPRFLKTITLQYPEIHLRIVELQTGQIIEKLHDGQLDAGILATPLELSTLKEIPIYFEPIMAYVPEDHRLANRDFVMRSELRLNDMLLLKDGHCFRQNVISLCDAAFPRTADVLEIETGRFETLIKLANQGFGMTLLPYLTSLDLSESDKKNVIPIEYPQPTRQISLAHNKFQLKNAVITILLETIKKEIPSILLSRKTQDTMSSKRQGDA